MDGILEAMEEVSSITATVNEYREISNTVSGLIDELKDMLFEMIYSLLQSFFSGLFTSEII